MVNTLGYFKYACKGTTIFAEKQISAQKNRHSCPKTQMANRLKVRG